MRAKTSSDDPLQGENSLLYEFFESTGGGETLSCFNIWLAAFHIIEMLYDTPFPTEPQNDSIPTQTERNADIRAKYRHGVSVVDLAREFELSEQRVSQIIHGRRN